MAKAPIAFSAVVKKPGKKEVISHYTRGISKQLRALLSSPKRYSIKKPKYLPYAKVMPFLKQTCIRCSVIVKKMIAFIHTSNDNQMTLEYVCLKCAKTIRRQN